MAKVSKSKPAGPANAGAEFPLLGYVDQLVDGLRTFTPAALKEFDPNAIHQARFGVTSTCLLMSCDTSLTVLPPVTRGSRTAEDTCIVFVDL